MQHDLPASPCCAAAARAQPRRRLARAMACSFLLLSAWMLLPEPAWAAQGVSFNLQKLDDVFCGFIDFSKSRLAPYIAVIVIMVGVIGHWLGATRMWGTMLYVAIGLGVILGIGSTVATLAGAGDTCLGQAG